MQLSLRKVGDQNIYYSESDTESSVQLVFIPGGFNADIWKHQLKYFSKNYKTVVFEPIQRKEGYNGEKEALKAVLDQKHLDRTVLISNNLSNPLTQEFEDREDVEAVFMTGRLDRLNKPSKTVYKLFWTSIVREPKLARKTLFSDSTDYKVLKQFSKDVKVPRYQSFESFLEKNVEATNKPSITVYGTHDRFTKLKSIRKVQKDSCIRVIERAGTFSFYEKPQEYNKALNDFLSSINERLEKDKVEKAKEKNRSLAEFQKKKVTAVK